MAMELKHLNPQHVMDVTGKAIDEISLLRAENAEIKRKLQDQCISCPVKMQEDDVVAELKQKLEDAQAKAYAESVDAGMENRKLKRALWLSRAEKARFLAMIIDQHPYTQVLHFTSRKRDDSGKPLGIARTAMEWWRMFKEVERKCRAKAKEYL